MNFSFSAATIVEDTLYYSDNYCNALFSIDLNSRKMNYISEFPEEKRTKQRIHKSCLRYKDKLIFIPNMGSHVHSYNLSNKEFETINIKRTSDSRFVFCAGIIRGDILWVFPRNLEQPIVKYDINNWTCEEMDPFYQTLGEIKKLRDELFWKMCCLDDKAYLAVIGTSKVVCYDLKKNRSYDIDTEIEGIYSIHSTGAGIIICTVDNRVFRWDCNTNTASIIPVLDEKKPVRPNMIAEQGDSIFLIPNYGSDILVKENDIFVRSDSLRIDAKNMNTRMVHFENWGQWKSSLVLYPNYGGDIELIKNRAVEKLVVETEFDNAYREKYLESIIEISKDKILNEGVDYCFEDFCAAVGNTYRERDNV